MKWIPVTERRPRDGQVVDWITSSGIEVWFGKYVSGLWYMPPECKSYTDKTPVFWRESVVDAKPSNNGGVIAKPARNEEGTRA